MCNFFYNFAIISVLILMFFKNLFRPKGQASGKEKKTHLNFQYLYFQHSKE